MRKFCNLILFQLCVQRNWTLVFEKQQYNYFLYSTVNKGWDCWIAWWASSASPSLIWCTIVRAKGELALSDRQNLPIIQSNNPATYKPCNKENSIVSILCCIYLINFSDLSLSVVYFDQLFVRWVFVYFHQLLSAHHTLLYLITIKVVLLLQPDFFFEKQMELCRKLYGLESLFKIISRKGICK